MSKPHKNELRKALDEWLETRNSTLTEIERVAGELDALQKDVTLRNMISGLIRVVGGSLVLGSAAMAVFTGGASLLLTEVGLWLSGGSTVTSLFTQVTDLFQKRTRLADAQKTLEKDKAQQKVLIDTFEDFLDVCILDSRSKQQIVELYDALWSILKNAGSAGSRLYGAGKFTVEAVSTTRYTGVVRNPGFTAGVRKLLTSSNVTFGVFVVVDLVDVVRCSVQMSNGSPSEAAKALREEGKALEKERDKLIKFFQQVRSHSAF